MIRRRVDRLETALTSEGGWAAVLEAARRMVADPVAQEHERRMLAGEMTLAEIEAEFPDPGPPPPDDPRSWASVVHRARLIQRDIAIANWAAARLGLKGRETRASGRVHALPGNRAFKEARDALPRLLQAEADAGDAVADERLRRSHATGSTRFGDPSGTLRKTSVRRRSTIT